MDLLKSARYYIKQGLNPIAVNSVKRSLFDWKQYQQRIITEEEIATHLQHQSAHGLAVICGAVSGGLEVIDIDLKYDITGTLFQRLQEAIGSEIFDKLYVVETRSGGYHLYYRCEVIEGNEKLAWRPKTAEELKEDPKGKKICLIETRGEAGYVIAPPTQGYAVTQRNPIPVISIDEREAIWTACRSFNEVVTEREVTAEDRQPAREYATSPFDDYNRRGDVIGLLEKHGWSVVARHGSKTHLKRPGKSDSRTSGNYDHDLGWFSVFTTNSVFEPEKAYRPYAVYAMLECDGDFKAAARKLAEAGYGERRVNYGVKVEQEVFRRKQDGQAKDEIITALVARHGKSAGEATEIIDTLEKQWGDEICTFWDIDKKGAPVINRFRLGCFLHDTGGFGLYFHGDTTIYRTVKLADGRVEETTTEQMKKFIKQYILSLPDSFDGGVHPTELLEVIYKGSDHYFSKSLMEFIDKHSLDFLKDEPTRAYFPFNNGVVVCEVGKMPVLKSYGEIKKHVWASQVIDFDITIDMDMDPSLVEYYRFLYNIAGKDHARLDYALTLIGYMLHSWKNPSRPYAPILAEETDDEKKGGGTGKGIFIKAISKLIPVVSVDGKNFKIDKNFAFQRVGFDTRLVVIEDCPRNVEFERFYPTITEGITIEKKNKDEIFLPYAESPKIAFTTNYSISQEAEHAKRRQRVFEFAPHYNSRFTPEDEFGHKFFDDWNRDEWNRFYNLLFTCVGAYLNNGVLVVDNSEKMKRKHIKLAYGEEFLEWFEEFAGNGAANWHSVTQEYTGFLRINEYDKKDYSIKRFRKALNESGSLMGFEMKNRKNKQNNGAAEFSLVKKGTGSGALEPVLEASEPDPF